MQRSADRLNFFTIVIAELMFDLFKRFAHRLRNEKSRKGYRNKTDRCKNYKSCLQTETVKQRWEEQPDNKVRYPHE